MNTKIQTIQKELKTKQNFFNEIIKLNEKCPVPFGFLVLVGDYDGNGANGSETIKMGSHLLLLSSLNVQQLQMNRKSLATGD